MNWRVALIALSAVAAIALLVWLLQGGKPQVELAEILEVVVLPTPTPAPEQRVILLFTGKDGMLHPELRSVPLPEEVHERIRVVMDELLAGPRSAPRRSRTRRLYRRSLSTNTAMPTSISPPHRSPSPVRAPS